MKDCLIYIDTAEKKPLIFPPFIEWWSPAGRLHRVQIHTEVKTLVTGDYVLASAPDFAAVERKNGPSELHENLFTKDWPRFERCLARLREVPRPALYLESSLKALGRPLALTRPTRTEFPANRILDRLLFELAQARIPLLTGTGATASGKREGGELVARFLLNATHKAPGASHV